MPVLSARGLSKAFGSRSLFKDLSLTIVRGERVGLLGENGTGKTTLLRVLAGLEPADEGTIERRRDARIMMLEQEPRVEPSATVRAIVSEGLADWMAAKRAYDEASAKLAELGDAAPPELLDEQGTLAESIERLGGWDRDHVVQDICGRLGVVALDRTVGTLSGGERRRVALARLLVARPDLAILDEPTNHLDTDTITWLEEHLATSFDGAVLVVTHDRYVLDAVCQRTVELDEGTLREFKGGYSDYVEQKAELIALGERTEQRRLNLLRREKAWLQRGAKARSTKQKARIQRAESLGNVEGPQDKARVSFSDLDRGAARLGKTILDLEDVTIDLAGRTLVRDLTLRLCPGDRVGVVGKNGAGKTSLLRAITGELVPTKGAITVGQNTRIAVVDQARATLEDTWSVFDNVAGFEGAERTGGGNVVIGELTLSLRSYLERFLFEGAKQRRAVGSLSGGERARVGLAKILKEGANLLMLDEPTNDLDTATLSSVEELLDSWPGCAIVVSHDRAFLDNVATAILAFEGDGRVVLYPGNYATYLSLKSEYEQSRALDAVSKDKAEKPKDKRAEPESPPPVATKQLSFAERKELDSMMDRIGELEATVAALSTELADPTLYVSRAREAVGIKARHDEAEAELERMMARWEELESRKERRR